MSFKDKHLLGIEAIRPDAILEILDLLRFHEFGIFVSLLGLLGVRMGLEMDLMRHLALSNLSMSQI